MKLCFLAPRGNKLNNTRGGRGVGGGGHIQRPQSDEEKTFEANTLGAGAIEPFRLSRCRTATTRVDYKALQLVQSGGRGERADTDFVRTKM